MGILFIKFQDTENAEKSNMVATHPEAISRVRDALRLLEQLGTAGAAELLNRVKASEPNPPSFVFQSHDGSGSQTNTCFDQELALQLPLATSLNNHLPWFVASLNEPPVDTINPALLGISEGVWDATVPRSTPESNCSSTVIDKNLSVPEAESTLFVSPASCTATGLGSCGQRAPQDGDTDFSPTPPDVSTNGNAQVAGSSEPVIGLSTPPSDPPSPATQITKGNGHCRLRSRRSKITKVTLAHKKKSLTKRSQVKKQPQSAGLKESSVMTITTLARNALCGLFDPDLQRALEAGEGLIRDGLSDYQGSCIWQENGFWSEDALSPSILTDSSAEEKFCHIFRYANTLVKRSSDQKLRLRISHAILYLSFETLMQEKRSGVHSRRLDNHDQHRAATLSADYLLTRSYPDNKYPLSKLDAVISYIVNAHPDVVCLYREFDAMAKQILLGETLTMRPTRQMIDDGICLAAVTKLTPQQAEENWQQIDPASASRKLIKKFVSNYV
ncbi:predicted protein [Histoplasma capsulatum H143]|uniref:Uncharacterized protein n=1 Tax=Ajellomyces capsulatus (strain H143) TaxID=544712 RepID=C6H5W2_AJECH|nr:predicted protein [Histoplasma capsulatum H143]